MQLAQPTFRTFPARAFGVGVFITSMLVAGSLAAQQVLMAPRIDLSFDSVQVTGRTDAVEVDYQLDPNDWTWANDFGMDTWLGIYTSGPTDQWQLQQVERLGAQQGEVSFEDAVGAGTDAIGLCLVVASVDGGKVAPGMGYVCETPLVVPTAGGRLAFAATDAGVALGFEQNVDQQPWYTAERGFGQAEAASAGLDESGLDESGLDESGVDQPDAEFFSYRAPSPTVDPRGAEAPRFERGYGPYDQRGFRGYPSQGMVIYTPGYLPGFFFDRDRVDVDRFRQRRLETRRIFGPLDGFDAKFDQDMFEAHPEDVFYNFPITPGNFGRDAFGRDLPHGFGVPPRVQPQLRHRGLGQPFD